MNSFHSALLLLWGAAAAQAQSDPRLTSWMTANSTRYARVTETTTTPPMATWPSPGIPRNAGSPSQALPAYADVQQILYSAGFVYMRSANLASHRMGPWYKEYEKITVNGLWPDNGRLTSKVPRNPTLAANPIIVSRQVAQGPVGVINGNITEPVTTLGTGGPATAESWVTGPSLAPGSGTVTLTWASVEGGTYKVEASTTLQTWTTLNAAVPATAVATQTPFTDPGGAASNSRRFYKVTRTGLATYDP